MLITPFLFAIFYGWFTPAPTPAPAPASAAMESGAVDTAELLYREIGLEQVLESSTFKAAHKSMESHGLHGHILAIADMTKPSTAKRLYIVDLDEKKLLMRTWVAHGQGSGELNCDRFSNREGSHQTSKGLYRVGVQIASPKHGAALLLHGLDKGLNDQALAREVIMHGADYVSAEFIASHGRLGRSWGCPAVQRADMPQMIALLADGGMLYVHGR